MKISVIGTGYVGLVTGVSLSQIGHQVTCIDIDEAKILKMRQGISPIFEPGLEGLMKANIEAGRLDFTSLPSKGFKESDIIYIAVGTPEKDDGSVNLAYINQVVEEIASNIERDVIVVTLG